MLDYRGFVSEEELASIYSAAFALVFASAVGPDNLPPLEAMSLGCPVVTADVPGAREEFGDAALYFSVTDEYELVEQLLQLREKGRREDLIQKGDNRARSHQAADYARTMVGVLDEFSRLARNWERCDSTFT